MLVFAMSEFPHSIEDAIEQLSELESYEPNGWFRWMHHGFYSLQWASGPGRFADRVPIQPHEVLWSFLGEDFELHESDDLPDLSLLTLLERDAWIVGILCLDGMVEKCWSSMSDFARSRFILGKVICAGWDLQNLDLHLESAIEFWNKSKTLELDGTSAAGLASLFLAFEKPELFKRVMYSVDHWREEQVIRLEPNGQSSERYVKSLPSLSDRAIDRCLEAALRKENLEAVKQLLNQQANPDINLWTLERSYNKKQCALSHAITECEGVQIAMALLDAGASASGTEYEGMNYPLFYAIAHGYYDLAEELINRGASFSNGPGPTTGSDRKGSESTVITPPFLSRHSKEEGDWVREAIGSLMNLAPVESQSYFYQPNAQGGCYSRFFPMLVRDPNVLCRFELLGFDSTPTELDILSMISSDSWEGLHFIFDREGIAEEAMAQVKMFKPDFGTRCRQFLCRPEPDGSNVIEGFDDFGQTPYVHSDGSRYFVDLAGIAENDHNFGEVPRGQIFTRKVKADYRREGNTVITENLSTEWELNPVPASYSGEDLNPCKIQDLLYMVKEQDGKHFRLGVSMKLFASYSWPNEYREGFDEWTKSKAGQYVLKKAESRILAQIRANRFLPDPVLSSVELDGYPSAYHPFLIRLEDGTISLTEESCLGDQKVKERYDKWATANKPDMSTWEPDPRVIEWVWWDRIPLELKPFFAYDETFKKPSVKHGGENDYEKAMIRKAIAWNNDQFRKAFEAGNMDEIKIEDPAIESLE